MPTIEDRIGAQTQEQVLSDFDAKHSLFQALGEKTCSLLREILDLKQANYHSVEFRVKDRQKLADKYSDPTKDYKSLPSVPDVVGFRIITYYREEIDLVRSLVEPEVEILGSPDDKRILKGDDLKQFGYSALHLDCRFSQNRLSLPEYSRFTGLRFEIQITTILGHAWSEINHGWYERQASEAPAEEVRGLHRLAAVLELADQEFSRLRKAKQDREKIASIHLEAKEASFLMPRGESW